jgi:hypothetical protein
VTNIFLLDGGWLCVTITGHPSSSISSTSTTTSFPASPLLTGGTATVVGGFGLRKKRKIQKKFHYCKVIPGLFVNFASVEACTLKCTKF